MINEAILKAYKIQNPVKYAQKFGHLEKSKKPIIKIKTTKKIKKTTKKNG